MAYPGTDRHITLPSAESSNQLGLGPEAIKEIEFNAAATTGQTRMIYLIYFRKNQVTPNMRQVDFGVRQNSCGKSSPIGFCFAEGGTIVRFSNVQKFELGSNVRSKPVPKGNSALSVSGKQLARTLHNSIWFANGYEIMNKNRASNAKRSFHMRPECWRILGSSRRIKGE